MTVIEICTAALVAVGLLAIATWAYARFAER